MAATALVTTIYSVKIRDLSPLREVAKSIWNTVIHLVENPENKLLNKGIIYALNLSRTKTENVLSSLKLLVLHFRCKILFSLHVLNLLI